MNLNVEKGNFIKRHNFPQMLPASWHMKDGRWRHYCWYRNRGKEQKVLLKQVSPAIFSFFNLKQKYPIIFFIDLMLLFLSPINTFVSQKLQQNGIIPKALTEALKHWSRIKPRITSLCHHLCLPLPSNDVTQKCVYVPSIYFRSGNTSHGKAHGKSALVGIRGVIVINDSTS